MLYAQCWLSMQVTIFIKIFIFFAEWKYDSVTGKKTNKHAIFSVLVWQVLKPGGIVLFRDYGLYDHAMLRFKSGSKLGENFYVRQDGTRSYFFSRGLSLLIVLSGTFSVVSVIWNLFSLSEYLASLFQQAGFQTLVNEYVLRETVNKKEGLCVPRVFLQSKYHKPEWLWFSSVHYRLM